MADTPRETVEVGGQQAPLTQEEYQAFAEARRLAGCCPSCGDGVINWWDHTDGDGGYTCSLVRPAPHDASHASDSPRG